jgi:Lactoylglutathione lyase and related lyases
MPIQVRQIDHVSLVVADLEASRRFYADLLGMTIVPRPAFDFGGLWLQAGSTLIHLIEQHKESGPAGNTIFPGASPSRTWHVAFLVDNVSAALAEMQTHQVRIASGPKKRPDGALQLFVFDPDGYVIELGEPAPPLPGPTN